jgi:hypothetical protein
MDATLQNLIVEAPRWASAPNEPKNLKTAHSDSAGAGNGLPLPHTVAEWQKNAREVIRVSLSNYQRRTVVDLRT